MKLPRADQAIIDPRKLRDYVLSPEHPVGRFKAAFFARIGFSPFNWERLGLELRGLAMKNTAELDEQTPFGRKYLVRGIISGPTGRTAEVFTVWIVLSGEEVPRLVTVYPGE